MKTRDVVVAAIAVALTVVAGLLVLNFRTGEKKIEQRSSVSTPRRRPAVPARRWACCSGRRSPAATATTCCSTATRSSRRCSAAIRGATKTITFETYIYWSGDDRPGVRRCAGRARARRRQGARAARLGRQQQDGRRSCVDEMKRPASRSRKLPPAALVPPRAAEQPHAPQAAGRRRPHRLHRRRRHRRRMDRPRAGPGPLARHAFPGRRARSSRRCRRCSWTTGSRPPATCCTARDYFPGARAGGRRPRRRCSAARRPAAARACS